MQIKPSQGKYVVVDENDKILFGPDTYEECEYFINPALRPGRKF